MKQVLRNEKTGAVRVVEVPNPSPGPGMVCVRTMASVISAGTEKAMFELARKGLIGKARARPDLVRQVVNKARTEGVLEAYRQARSRLDTPTPLGNSSAGVVIEVGEGMQGLSPGDRVACAGSGYASHSEVGCVPEGLCRRIPESVSLEEAGFAMLGSIALHAVRMARVGLGDRVAVIGLGLLGQLAVQLLRAAGCRVFGMDVDAGRVSLASEHGLEAGAVAAEEAIQGLRGMTGGVGADVVLIFASTPENAPIELAAEMARDRGRIVVPGLVGLDLPRRMFYEKELELVVPRSGGPGVYEPGYAEGDVAYPDAYVRWTWRDNLDEFLRLLGEGVVRVDHLISHRFPIERAEEAFELLMGEAEEPYLGILVTYPSLEEARAESKRVWLTDVAEGTAGISPRSASLGVGVIGAGQFAAGILLPLLKSLKGLELRGVASPTGTRARHLGDKFGFAYCASDASEILEDAEIDLVFILTRHGSHGELASRALQAGKHVFVEKPLALTLDQLRGVVEAINLQPSNLSTCQPIFMVGFNRRFSPFTVWLKKRFAGVKEPLAVHCTVNAGRLPSDHWVYDSEEGGGRILGEVCHYVDLVETLTGSVPVRVYAETMASEGYRQSDNVAVSLKLADGSIGSITYVAGGDKRAPKERVEVYGGGGVGIIDNFKRASFTRGGSRQQKRNWLRVDRGHRGEVEALVEAIGTGGPAPVPFQEYVYTTLATFAIEESLRTGKPVEVDPGVVFSDPSQT